jgi:5'-nucleotidase
VNVNFPLAPAGSLWTRQSVRHYDGKVVPIRDPLGRQLYWFTVVPMEAAEEGTDRWALERGLISITPLRLDLTDHPALQARI